MQKIAAVLSLCLQLLRSTFYVTSPSSLSVHRPYCMSHGMYLCASFLWVMGLIQLDVFPSSQPVLNHLLITADMHIDHRMYGGNILKLSYREGSHLTGKGTTQSIRRTWEDPVSLAVSDPVAQLQGKWSQLEGRLRNESRCRSWKSPHEELITLIKLPV